MMHSLILLACIEMSALAAVNQELVGHGYERAFGTDTFSEVVERARQQITARPETGRYGFTSRTWRW